MARIRNIGRERYEYGTDNNGELESVQPELSGIHIDLDEQVKYTAAGSFSGDVRYVFCKPYTFGPHYWFHIMESNSGEYTWTVDNDDLYIHLERKNKNGLWVADSSDEADCSYKVTNNGDAFNIHWVGATANTITVYAH